MFRTPGKLQNHGNEGKRKEKKKQRGEGKEAKKKSNVCVAVNFLFQLIFVFPLF